MERLHRQRQYLLLVQLHHLTNIHKVKSEELQSIWILHPQLNSYLQITLVDCPGHSSLIRTVIGGIQIINGIILVLDATQGFQHQTNECLLLAKIFCKPVLVVLNKL